MEALVHPVFQLVGYHVKRFGDISNESKYVKDPNGNRRCLRGHLRQVAIPILPVVLYFIVISRLDLAAILSCRHVMTLRGDRDETH
jgi:hypothetical protein